MRPSYYWAKWDQLKVQPDVGSLESLAHRIASTFVDRCFYSDEYNPGYIRLLCHMATFFKDSDLNQIASNAIFGLVIERLCDDFEELQTETYNRLICQIVDFLRTLPEGMELDQELDSFNLSTEDQLYQRIESIRLSPDERIPASINPRKVIVLSRVTVGADVAITSVICQRVAERFPNASIHVMGSGKVRQIFTSKSGVKVHELHYERRGGLVQRFLVWINLLQQVRQEIDGLDENQFLLLDPDSRLTQLGVLPLVSAFNYRFFNSRGKAGYPVKASISELTNLWLDNILGHGDYCFPRVWPETPSMNLALGLRTRTDPHQSCHFITLNFGVGGNSRKRVEDNFETGLVLKLLQDQTTRVFLDLGFGSDEHRRSQQIIDAARSEGFSVQEIAFKELESANADTRLFGVHCSVAEISALIAISDEFIGYDSACQHIAAAQGIRTYTVFAGTNNARFIRRWRACGPGLSEILYVDTVSRDRPIDQVELVERLMDLRNS